MHKAIGQLGGGRRQPYEDEDCDHEYEQHGDAGEEICAVCGDRRPIPLDRLMR